jgi:hypothetical protein
MLVFEIVTMLIKCSIFSCSAGRTLYTHKQSEVNTKQIQFGTKITSNYLKCSETGTVTIYSFKVELFHKDPHVP